MQQGSPQGWELRMENVVLNLLARKCYTEVTFE